MYKGIITAVVIIMLLPPTFALNCTLYHGDKHDLCNEIDPLDIAESEKERAMDDDLWQVTQSDEPINLQINIPSEEVETLNQVYEENIALAVKIALFLLFNYALFSFLTKPNKIRRWLTADS